MKDSSVNGDVQSGDGSVEVLVRLTGEVSTKGRRTRARFQRRLASNIRDACRAEGIVCRVRDEWSRLYVDGDERVGRVLGRVFGISSHSIVDAACEAGLDRIVSVGSALYTDVVRGRRYAVRARRSGRSGFSSRDVMVHLGAALNEAADVDLDDPEVEIWVEVREGTARFYRERVPGPGGLPLGVEGRAVALLSGGFDSAVAAWMMLRRGVELDYVFCNLGGEAYRRLVAEVAKVVADRWSYGTSPSLYALDFLPIVEELRASVRPSYHQIVLKRQMYRAASAVAARVGAEAVVTGEAVGQVSSQTLTNLRAIDDASEYPVLRPLVGMDKEEIIARARAIGTYSRSARVREYCALGSGRPATAASAEAVRSADRHLDASRIVAAVEAGERLDLRRLDLAQLAGGAVFAERIPAGAVVVDTRDAEAFTEWHWEGALHAPADELARTFGELDRGGVYVLYCAQGLESARVAERMQQAGYEAYSFLGGEAALRRLQASAERAGQAGHASGETR